MSQKNYTRREWLRRSAALGAISSAHLMLPRWMPRMAFSPRHQAPRGDVLICIFLRGGADSLNMIVPFGEEAYYAARPNLAIPRPDDNSAALKTIDLDGFFGLHPALANLHPIFANGQMKAIHATGSPDPTRSHFEAMSYMEFGTPGEKSVTSGWIARHLSTLDTGNTSPVRAVGWGTAAQKSLAGGIAPVVLKSIADYHLGGRVDVAMQLMQSINTLYQQDTEALAATANATVEAVDLIGKVDMNQYVPQNGAVYPEDDFSFGLKQTAAIIRADMGLEVACLDLGGWDTHAQQGSTEGEQAGLMNVLANGLAAFHQDMGPDMARVTVVVMSEFGRRLKENADIGTDHGHGGAMLVMSGQFATNSPVLTQWPGLDEEHLDNGDLAITIDYRNVLAEILQYRLNNPLLQEVFPNFTPEPVGLF
ncbi:MAG: hypothetical protein CUN55_01245 [Phototrophicales bacterium]|nr:MAG: hypothetical protein CUN55_01245 [Phototrophicales bacterium]